MVKEVHMGKRTRMSFAKIDEIVEMPDLIEIQKNSYQRFLETDFREVLEDVSPITDYSNNLVLEFIDYTLDDEPKYSVEECKERDVNYSAPLRVLARLRNRETGEVKEQSVFMGDFPLMTESGTFIINGAERVIVSQLVRSPGVYYDETVDKSGQQLYSATVIPNRGAWLEYETDSNLIMWVKVDRTRKVPMTVLLRAIGFGSDSQIREMLGEDERLLATLEKDNAKTEDEGIIEIYKRMRPGEPANVESARSLFNSLFFDARRYDLAKVGRYKFNKKLSLAGRITGFTAAEDVVDPATGEVFVSAGEKIEREQAVAIQNAGINTVDLTVENRRLRVVGNHFVDAAGYLSFDPEEAGISDLVHYPALKAALELELDEKGLKEYLRSHMDELAPKHILVDDIVASVSYAIGLSYSAGGRKVGTTDDIDHLGNRRVRSVGELLQNQIRIGMSRLERVVKERMSIQDVETATPQALINVRPVSAAIKEFFGSSQLSQFMDQTNPLSELTNKRRLSALGPGGLNRERASFEVRDVHHSHYGRMCPIESPEGPNIGLIGALCTYARINKYGFIESPYRRIDKATGRVTDEICFMTADEEENYVITQANVPLDENGAFLESRVTARVGDEIIEVSSKDADYMDVSPRQLVSVAAAMIPFLENDDASRALMGANMQRQAVPLLVPQAPYVGTGIEYRAARDSGVVTIAKRGGVVNKVDATCVEIKTDLGEIDRYNLSKFTRSNQGTCINQRPVVQWGQKIQAGDTLADGASTDNGEMALGRNILMGFMTWEGYNYEDAILISEKLVKEDVFTSIHIEEYESEARDTKLGPEEITRDIPNVGDEALKDLDDRGIIRIGAEVHAGDILVGKVTPKGETELTAEERLLRAIFGEKSREVRDTSLRVPHGEGGIIVDVKEFTRENKDELSPGVNRMVRVYIAQKRKISVGDKMAGRHGNKGVISRILPEEDMPFLPDGTPLQIVLNPLGVPSRMNIGQVLEVHLGWTAKALGWHVATPVFDGAAEENIHRCMVEYGIRQDNSVLGEGWIDKALAADTSLEPDLKAWMLDARAQALARPDYTVRDWTDVAIELDEEKGGRALAWMRERMEENMIRDDGKVYLHDGRTGELFDNPTTVGYMYMLKLHHLVDDKIHARSTGPYSLVTQQPLGGKAQFGGQRFGEMEVWALEAYGAAHVLQEILTVKSDDVVGRVKTYESIVKGENLPEPGIPESFKVLIKELQSMALDVRILTEGNEEISLRESIDDDADLIEPSDERETGVQDFGSYEGGGAVFDDLDMDDLDDLPGIDDLSDGLLADLDDGDDLDLGDDDFGLGDDDDNGLDMDDGDGLDMDDL